MARQWLIALGRLLTTGVLPEGAKLQGELQANSDRQERLDSAEEQSGHARDVDEQDEMRGLE